MAKKPKGAKTTDATPDVAETAEAELEPAGGDELDPEEEPVEPEPDTQVDAGATVDMDALYARATALKVKNRRKMNAAELLEAVQQAELEGGVPAVDEPGDPEPEVEGAPKPEPTQEQAQRIFAARTDQLEGAVADPKFPDHLRALVVQELGRRSVSARAQYDRERAMGPMQRFKVTKGGRYISKDGFITELPAGSVLTPDTHDLKHVAGQGIEFAPAVVVAVGLDQLGKQISEIR